MGCGSSTKQAVNPAPNGQGGVAAVVEVHDSPQAVKYRTENTTNQADNRNAPVPESPAKAPPQASADSATSPASAPALSPARDPPEHQGEAAAGSDASLDEEKAAIRIQSQARRRRAKAYTDAIRADREAAQKEAAAVRIQAQARRRQASRRVDQVRASKQEELTAAQEAQDAAQAAEDKLGEAASDSPDDAHIAALRIQAQARRRAAQKRVAQIRKELEEARKAEADADTKEDSPAAATDAANDVSDAEDDDARPQRRTGRWSTSVGTIYSKGRRIGKEYYMQAVKTSPTGFIFQAYIPRSSHAVFKEVSQDELSALVDGDSILLEDKLKLAIHLCKRMQVDASGISFSAPSAGAGGAPSPGEAQEWSETRKIGADMLILTITPDRSSGAFQIASLNPNTGETHTLAVSDEDVATFAGNASRTEVSKKLAECVTMDGDALALRHAD